MTNSHNGADAEIADRITAELGKAKVSLLALSDSSGIPYPTLRRSVNAGRSLSIQQIGSIATALNIHPSALLPPSLTQDAA